MNHSQALALSCSLFAASACGEPSFPESRVVSSKVEGRVHLPSGVVAEGEVRVFGGLDPTDAVACESTLRGGAFSCELGPLSGDLLVRFEAGEGRLDAVVRELVLGEERADVSVSAITHLHAQYARRLGEASDQEVFEHFGGLDHARLAPSFDSGAEGAALSAAVLSRSFVQLAADLRGDSGAASRWTALRLVGLLGDDLGADGSWDGEGPDGPLSFGGRRLNGVTLRAEYARAILRWLRSDENSTTLTAADWVLTARALAASTSPLFRGAAAPLDEEGPEIGQLRVERPGAETLPPHRVGRSFRLVFAVSDLVSVENVEVEFGNIRAPTVGTEEGYEVQLSSVGLPHGETSLAVFARDADGNVSTATKTIEVDAVGPDIEAAILVQEGGAVRVEGVAQDSSGVLRLGRARLSEANSEFTVDESGAFTFELRQPCVPSAVLTLELEDGLGNLARRDFVLDCTPPPFAIRLLPTAYYPATELEVVQSANGFSYVPIPGARNATLSERSSWPIGLEKFVTRLDATSENLVKLRFATPPGAQVSYRWLADGSEGRDWTELEEVDGAVYELPLSYQSLGEDLGLLARNAIQSVEIRAVRGPENVIRRLSFRMRLYSPPVIFDGCSASPLTGVGLAEGNLHGLFAPGAEPSMFQASLSWAPGVEASSLSPVQELSMMAVGSVEFAGRATEIREDLHWGGLVANDLANFPYWCPPDSYLFADAGPTDVVTAVESLGCGSSDWACAFLHCLSGNKSDDEVLWDAEQDGPIRDWSEIRRTGGAALFRGPLEVDQYSDGYHVALGEDVRLIVRMIAEPHEISGEAYEWDGLIQIPANYTPTPGPARYRLPGHTRAGINFGSPSSPTSARAWAASAYLGRFEFTAVQPDFSARLLSNPDVEVPVVYADDCDFVFDTTY